MTPGFLAPALVALGALGEPAPTQPAPAPDTTLGRIDGDVSVVLGLGATVASRGPRAAADVRVRYLDTVGVFAGYEDASIFASDSDPKRVIDVGLELRPLFLARWLRGMELGVPHVDLAVDSIGLEMGPYFAQANGGPFAARPGIQLGGGIEIPVFAHASGPWIGIHGGVRWSDAVMGGDSIHGPIDRGGFLSLTLAWHQFFGAHVVDVGDRPP